MPAERPNILVFMTDQERADAIHPERTPHAWRLAQAGIRFSQTYTCTAHCCPSRATFMTGGYPSRHGIYNNVSTPTAIHLGLNPGVPMFSERLREAGYRMAFSGKWHVSAQEDPHERGWEELRVTAPKGGYMHRGIEQWSAQGKYVRPSGPDAPVRKRGEVLRPGWGNYQAYAAQPVPPELAARPWEAHHDWLTVKAALDALPGLAAGQEPWFLYVGPHGPHDPFFIPEPYAKLYRAADVELPPNFRDTLEDKPRIYQRMRKQYWGQLSEEEVKESIAHYWGYCRMEDDYLGLVLAALERSGQAENTLVIFLSDHGEYLGSHGLYCKGVPAFREGYHIPCVMRWPKGIRNPGREVDEFLTLADFAPSFVDLAGARGLGETTGRSFEPFLRDARPPGWTDTFYTQFNGVELYYSQRAVQTKRHKYVYNGFDFDEFYDLEKDPHELVNVADRPEYQDAKRELCRRMWRFAAREKDNMLFNGYATVAMAPWGPADSL